MLRTRATATKSFLQDAQQQQLSYRFQSISWQEKLFQLRQKRGRFNFFSSFSHFVIQIFAKCFFFSFLLVILTQISISSLWGMSKDFGVFFLRQQQKQNLKIAQLQL